VQLKIKNLVERVMRKKVECWLLQEGEEAQPFGMNLNASQEG
jgi:hypothetical protein